MLRIHFFNIFTIKMPRALSREDTDTINSGGNYKYSKSNVNRTVSNLYKKRKKPCTTLLIISLENSGLSSSTHTLYTVESFINIGSSI